MVDLAPDTSRETAASFDLRALYYQWLSGFYVGELTEVALEQYQSEDSGPLLAMLSEREEFAAILDDLHSRIKSADKTQTLVLDLAAAFGRLFLGAGGPHSAPPYQSIFEGEHVRLYQNAASEMNEVLQELDISMAVALKEPADHLAIQLQVMAVLAKRADVERQIAFIKKHLVSWIGLFEAACDRNDPSRFYAHVAKATRAFIEDDLSWLEGQQT